MTVNKLKKEINHTFIRPHTKTSSFQYVMNVTINLITILLIKTLIKIDGYLTYYCFFLTGVCFNYSYYMNMYLNSCDCFYGTFLTHRLKMGRY